MANLKSSKKDVRRAAVKAAANKGVRTSLKTYVKKVRVATEAEDAAATAEALQAAVRNIDKAVQRGIIHKNQAARRKSRIAKAAAVVTKGQAAPKKAAAAKAAPKAATAKAAPKKAAPKKAAPKKD